MLLCLAACVAAEPLAAQPAKPQMACKIGPIEKTYGSTQWKIYSCDDHKSLVFVSAPGSPASPFYFLRSPEGVSGEGTGSKQATDAAYAEIAKLTTADAGALIQATVNAQHASN